MRCFAQASTAYIEVPYARCRFRFIFYFLFFYFYFLFFYLAHAYAAEEALDRNGRASILDHIAQKASHCIGFAVPPVVAGVAGVQGAIVAGVAGVEGTIVAGGAGVKAL